MANRAENFVMIDPVTREDGQLRRKRRERSSGSAIIDGRMSVFLGQ